MNVPVVGSNIRFVLRSMIETCTWATPTLSPAPPWNVTGPAGTVASIAGDVIDVTGVSWSPGETPVEKSTVWTSPTAIDEMSIARTSA